MFVQESLQTDSKLYELFRVPSPFRPATDNKSKELLAGKEFVKVAARAARMSSMFHCIVKKMNEGNPDKHYEESLHNSEANE